jgi:hypothetical protein
MDNKEMNAAVRLLPTTLMYDILLIVGFIVVGNSHLETETFDNCASDIRVRKFEP